MRPGVLHVIGGNDRGKRFELSGIETRIGRGADQDVVLSDIAVSRRHVTVHFEGGRYRLKDLGSGNGTLVNGQRVDSYVLSDGDHVEIGQTVLRFDHPDSRAVAPSPYVPPRPVRPVPPAPSAQMPFDPPAETPSDAVALPAAPALPSDALATGVMTGRALSGLFALLATRRNRLLALGGMGLLSILGVTVIFARTVLAKPPVVASEAEEMYRQGLRLYAAGDYEGAKVAFLETMQQVPDSPEAKRYARLCDVEVQARGAMRNAERALASKRYVEALKSLEKVESASVLFDQAMRLRGEHAARAAAEDVDEARRLAPEDPDTAKARIQHALELDPANAEAQALAAKLRAGAPIAALAPKPEPVEAAAPARAPAERPRPRENVSAARRPAPSRDSAPAKPPSKPSTAGSPLPSGAQAAYAAKDFAAAEKVCRVQAVENPKQSERLLEAANQVRQLKQLIDRAASTELSKPDQAMRDYEEALALDAKLGRGAHAAWIKQRLGKVHLGAARLAFQQGKYDVAFAQAQAAQRLGVGDDGLLGRLEAKAAEFTQKGLAVQKANIGQAKQYWRMVIRMVPVGSSTYAKAYQLLNNSATAHRDEDED